MSAIETRPPQGPAPLRIDDTEVLKDKDRTSLDQKEPLKRGLRPTYTPGVLFVVLCPYNVPVEPGV